MSGVLGLCLGFLNSHQDMYDIYLGKLSFFITGLKSNMSAFYSFAQRTIAMSNS